MKNALTLQEILEKAGHRTLAAGGFVRDLLLDRKCNDIDLATTALPEDTQRILEAKGIKTIPTGLKHGTITAVVNKVHYEITTLRIDQKCFGRDVEVEFTDSFEVDASRRDFTMNGMFYDLKREKVIDYVGGQQDIKLKLIKFIGKPEDRIKEDYLRILRMYRFYSQLGFDVAPETYNEAQRHIPYLSYISQERIRDEILKALVGDFVDKFLQCKKIIFFVFPELLPCNGFEQNSRYHIYDVYTHMAKGVEFLNNDKDSILSLAHFFHDIAKPFCHSRDDKGIDHFYGHEIEGKRIAANMCHRLKISDNDTKRIKFLVRNHMTLHMPMKSRGYRRLINRCKEFNEDTSTEDLLKIFEADCRGMNRIKMPIFYHVKEEFNKHIDNYKPTIENMDPLSGKEIMTIFNIEPGSKVGEVKKYLRQLVIDGELSVKDPVKAEHFAKMRFQDVHS